MYGYRHMVISFCLSLFLFTGAAAQSAETLLLKAREFYDQNDYEKAQVTYIQALKQADMEKNPSVAARASLSLARCHYFLYDHDASFKWSYHGLHIIQEHHLDSLLSQACYFLGVLYIEEEQVDSAEKYSFMAIEQMRRDADYKQLSQMYSALAELHLNTSRDTARIEALIAEAERYATLSQDKGMMAFAESKRYNYCFFLKRDFQQALVHINRAESLYLETGNREAILNAYRGKAECLIMLRDTAARTYMLQWFAFKDSVLQAEKSVNIAKYETLYETERKEQENKILHQQNNFHRLLLVAAAILFLLFAVIVLWLLNHKNLKKKQQELLLLQKLQHDKERIARDLHDHVGGQLSYIMYSLDGINAEEEGRRKEVTESIRESVRIVISSLRETIWAISDATIPVQDFSDKLKVFARNLFKHSRTQVHFTEHIVYNRPLNALLGLNLYRICQEILTNAFKYADAADVMIELHNESEKLSILIYDNGIGFDPIRQDTHQYGLQNIRKRAAELDITLELEAEPGKGTKYTLTV